MKQFPVLSGILTAARCRQLHRVATFLGVTAVAVCVVLPSASRAQGFTAATGNAGLILPVAATNLTALPDAAIAVVTGMGLKTAQPVNGNTGSAPSIVLWDELRPSVQQPLIDNGLATVTVNGAMQ
jgi:hypothetical protein